MSADVRAKGAGGYELLEHTADVGIRAWGSTLEAAFEQAAWALADLLGAVAHAPGERRAVVVRADDDGALLVDLLNELIFFHEREAVGLAAIRIERDDGELRAELELAPLPEATEGTSVKAATYHQLEVRRDPGGLVEARVYLDV